MLFCWCIYIVPAAVLVAASLCHSLVLRCIGHQFSAPCPPMQVQASPARPIPKTLAINSLTVSRKNAFLLVYIYCPGCSAYGNGPEPVPLKAGSHSCAVVQVASISR